MNEQLNDFADDLPELTDDERAALDSIPKDAVSHWRRGEKWDFKKKVWFPTRVQTRDSPGY